MKTGFSTSHMFNADEKFLQWTADQLSDIDYTRFEVCHETVNGRGLGAVDDFVKYNV
ncbi:MAG: hypothetical protein ACYTFY_13685 [Planctomycetota bacterium]